MEGQWIDAQRKSHFNIYKRTKDPVRLKTFPSTQEQLPALERIAKVSFRMYQQPLSPL
jgi:hypothetical protein